VKHADYQVFYFSFICRSQLFGQSRQKQQQKNNGLLLN